MRLTPEASCRPRFVALGPIHYANSIDLRSPLAHIHPALVKRQTIHSSQREIRAIWTPRQAGNIQPEFVICPEAWRYCEVHHVVRDGTPVKP